MASGIKKAEVNPAFLEANAQVHTEPFSAIAELIDNAQDPDVLAKEIRIDQETIAGRQCLTFLDNGSGMDPEKLHRMLSFGFCEKESDGKFKPIGKYGNGFKSGSMRLGDDAIVITRCNHSTSIGFLSKTFLRKMEVTSVLIPVVTWSVSSERRIKRNTEENTTSLKAILEHSLFRTETEINRELDAFKRPGTKIIIYNLKRHSSAILELDFQSDIDDIRYPETAEVDTTTLDRPVELPAPEHRRSLRKYCSILYKEPRIKIYLRGKKVMTTLIERSLVNTEYNFYKPKDYEGRRGVKLTFGCSTDKSPEAYGLLLYHNNRLIKAFEKVGCQNKPNREGIGVVGIVEANFLQPTQNKQDFVRNARYTAFMAQAGKKLSDYVREKTYGRHATTPESVNDNWWWVECDECGAWRRIPRQYKDKLPEKWVCYLNPDAGYNRCEIPQEPYIEDEKDIKKTYKKTAKKQHETEVQDQLSTETSDDTEILYARLDRQEITKPSYSQADRFQQPSVGQSKTPQKVAIFQPPLTGLTVFPQKPSKIQVVKPQQASTSQTATPQRLSNNQNATLQQAKKKIKRTLEPKNVEEEVVKGDELYRQGKYSEAMKHFQCAKRMNPHDPVMQKRISECHSGLGDFKKALAAVNKSLQIDPLYAKGYLQRGRIYRSLNKSAAAANDFKRAHDLDPASPEAELAFQSSQIDRGSDSDTSDLSICPNASGNIKRTEVTMQPPGQKRKNLSANESNTPIKFQKVAENVSSPKVNTSNYPVEGMSSTTNKLSEEARNPTGGTFLQEGRPQINVSTVEALDIRKSFSFSPLKNQISRKEREREECKKKIVQLTAEIDAQKQQLLTQQRTMNGKEKRINKLKTEVASLKSQIKTINAKVSKKEKELQKHKEAAKKKDEEFDEITSALIRCSQEHL